MARRASCSKAGHYSSGDGDGRGDGFASRQLVNGKMAIRLPFTGYFTNGAPLGKQTPLYGGSLGGPPWDPLGDPLDRRLFWVVLGVF